MARTVHVLGSIRVTEQVANRLGHRQVHSDKDTVPQRHIMLHCVFVFSWSDPELILR